MSYRSKKQVASKKRLRHGRKSRETSRYLPLIQILKFERTIATATIILVAFVMLGLLMGCSEEPVTTGGGGKVNDPTGGGKKVIEHYSDGQKRSEGYMLEGIVRVGHWTYWHKNGEKGKEGEFMDGKEHGYWTTWYENGQKRVESEYKDGKAHGDWTSWHENGKKAGEGESKDGKPYGYMATWYENGQKWMEFEGKDHKEEVRWTYWNKDGAIDNEKSGIYKNNEKFASLTKKD